MKNPNPHNQLPDFYEQLAQVETAIHNIYYESLKMVRDTDQLTALCRLPEYEDVYECAGCHEAILDNAHAYASPDGSRYHNRDCIVPLEELINDR